MNDRLNSDLTFIRHRLDNTIAVQASVADEWVWTEMSLAAWEAKQEQFGGSDDSLYNTQIGLEQEVNLAIGELSGAIKDLHFATVTGVGLARVRFRNEVEFTWVLGALSAGGGGRQTVLDEAEDWALAWEDMAPDWEAGMSLAAFEALRQAALAAMRKLRRVQIKMRRGAGRLRVMALEVEDLCQAWYAAATAIFPADTVNGSVVRSIKTTYDLPKKRGRRAREGGMTNDE